MNGRVILAGVLGGVVYFFWGFLSWMVLPWHNSTMPALANEDAVMEALRPHVTEAGAYFFPYMPDPKADEATMEAYKAKHLQGPMGFLVIEPTGKECTMAPTMIRGVVMDIVAALLLALLLARKAPGTYTCRVVFVVTIAVFAALVAHGPYWNWMLFPTDYTLVMCADLIIGWTLAALVMGAIVKPAPQTI